MSNVPILIPSPDSTLISSPHTNHHNHRRSSSLTIDPIHPINHLDSSSTIDPIPHKRHRSNSLTIDPIDPVRSNSSPDSRSIDPIDPVTSNGSSSSSSSTEHRHHVHPVPNPVPNPIDNNVWGRFRFIAQGTVLVLTYEHDNGDSTAIAKFKYVPTDSAPVLI
jgi:hypothetical protein